MFKTASSGRFVIVLDLEVVKGHLEPQMVNNAILLANINKVWPNECDPDIFHELSVALKEFEKQNILENKNSGICRSTFSK